MPVQELSRLVLQVAIRARAGATLQRNPTSSSSPNSSFNIAQYQYSAQHNMQTLLLNVMSLRLHVTDLPPAGMYKVAMPLLPR
jgi:hypothetical protein